MRLLPAGRALRGALIGIAAVAAFVVAAPSPVRSSLPTEQADTAGLIKIMPLGDSITYGVGSQTSSSYRVDLYQRLQAAGWNTDFVGGERSGAGRADLDNEGHPGWTIAQITEQIEGWLASHQPDVVLLHIGTNDMRTAVRAVDAAERLSALIDRIAIARPAADIFVSKIIGSKSPSVQQRIIAYNAALPAIVTAKGPRVHLVDNSTVGGMDLRDTLHPNDFGFAKMAYTWYEALRRAYNTEGPAWPASNNPNATIKRFLCFLNSTVVAGENAQYTECRWWHRRTVTESVSGQRRTVQRWQTQRALTETYRTRINDKLVTKTRTVIHWVNH